MRLPRWLNRYLLFDVLIIVGAVGVGFSTAKIVYEGRCKALLGELVPITEEALRAHEHWQEAQRDTLDQLPDPPTQVLTEVQP